MVSFSSNRNIKRRAPKSGPSPVPSPQTKRSDALKAKPARPALSAKAKLELKKKLKGKRAYAHNTLDREEKRILQDEDRYGVPNSRK